VLNLLQAQGKNITTDHGELPSTRMQPSRLFLTTGVDSAGPISQLLGTITRSKTVTKGYILFYCFVPKAVHIEVVTSLTAEAFLLP
jgi:hypothetical protein